MMDVAGIQVRGPQILNEFPEGEPGHLVYRPTQKCRDLVVLVAASGGMHIRTDRPLERISHHLDDAECVRRCAESSDRGFVSIARVQLLNSIFVNPSVIGQRFLQQTHVTEKPFNGKGASRLRVPQEYQLITRIDYRWRPQGNQSSQVHGASAW